MRVSETPSEQQNKTNKRGCERLTAALLPGNSSCYSPKKSPLTSLGESKRRTRSPAPLQGRGEKLRAQSGSPNTQLAETLDLPVLLLLQDERDQTPQPLIKEVQLERRRMGPTAARDEPRSATATSKHEQEWAGVRGSAAARGRLYKDTISCVVFYFISTFSHRPEVSNSF